MTNLYEVTITVDNNRYGCYYRRYKRVAYNIEASSEKDAYKIAANELKSHKRYKNAEVRHINNRGHHDISSWSINCESIKLLRGEK